jgi:hypothetical protein
MLGHSNSNLLGAEADRRQRRTERTGKFEIVGTGDRDVSASTERPGRPASSKAPKARMSFPQMMAVGLARDPVPRNRFVLREGSTDARQQPRRAALLSKPIFFFIVVQKSLIDSISR